MGIEVVMLTGDNARRPRAIARELGIERVRSAMSCPRTRPRRSLRLKGTGARVGMAGDGINDAPALAAADVSFAICVRLRHRDRKRRRHADARRPDGRGRRDQPVARHAVEDPPEPVFAFVYNVLGIPLAAAGMLEPGHRRRGDGVVIRFRGGELAAAAAVAPGRDRAGRS